MTDELINGFNTALLEFNKLNRKVKETLSDPTSSTIKVVGKRLTHHHEQVFRMRQYLV